MKGHGHPDWKGSLMSSTNDKTDPQQGKSPNSFKVMNIKKDSTDFHREIDYIERIKDFF